MDGTGLLESSPGGLNVEAVDIWSICESFQLPGLDQEKYSGELNLLYLIINLLKLKLKLYWKKTKINIPK